LNSGRNLYVVATIVAVICLLAGGAAVWQNSGSEEGWLSAGYVQLVVSVGCVIGAVGVIWLGWQSLRLAEAIAFTAAWLRGDKSELIKPSRNPRANSLVEAVNAALAHDTNQADDLENQVKDLKIRIQLAQRRQKNAEAIIYSLRDAVVVVDEFDKLMTANEAAGKLLEFDFRTSHHKPLRELIDADHSEFVDFVTQSKSSKGRASRREIEFPGDETPRTFDCVVSCVFDQSDQICGAAAVLHDITREKEVAQMKNDFVSHVSHELKTPLASITAYSEMLADGEADDEETRKEFYSVIQNQAKRLNRLIEDILNISRIESGLIKVSKEQASLTMLIEEQLQMIKSYAEEKNIEVIGQKPIVFDQVRVDKDMISQVIVNLLSNAVKYTPAGGSVRIKTEVDELARLARVTVTR